MRKQLFLDMDGVFANFDKQFELLYGMDPDSAKKKVGEEHFWELVLGFDNFFENMPVIGNVKEALAAFYPYRPVFLTGVPKSDPTVAWQKARWAKKHCPGVPVCCCYSREKSSYARKGDVIVDDRLEYQSLWKAKGGVFIHYEKGKDWNYKKIMEVHKAMEN